MLGNLVTNAVTYGAPDSTVTVTSLCHAGGAAFTVHNVGNPIPVADQKRIFDAMVRATTEGAASRSVGLGLFIVRELARAHGGTATVRSTAEDGTVFHVDLGETPVAST